MNIAYMNPDKYQLAKALRPFSYAVAIVTCGLGGVLACTQVQGSLVRAGLVILAGIFLQAACNLINDYADISLWQSSDEALAAEVIKSIRLNSFLAIVLTIIASVIGIWLAAQVGWQLIVIGVLGIIGGYSYTGEPLNYKRLGLGVVATFVFTGVLMVSAAYYAAAGVWNVNVIFISIPVSLLSSALLLANEIRDYVDDRRLSIHTLTVRMGFKFAKYMYASLLLIVFPVSILLFFLGLINNIAYLLPSLLCIYQPIKRLACEPGSSDLAGLPQLTGRFYLLFGIGFMLSVT